MFSVVEAVLLRPLPFPEAERIVYLYEDVFRSPFDMTSVRPATYLDWRERQESFEFMAAMGRVRNAVVTGDGDPEGIRGAGVSGDYFRVFGVEPLMGRTFASSEDGPDPPKVVVVSHGFWTSRLGGDPEAVGRTVRLDGEPYTVIGIMPPAFGAFRDPIGRTYRIELWWLGPFPNETRTDRSAHYLTVLARLEAGTDLGRAGAEMDAIALALAEEYPGWNEGYGAGIYPLAQAMTEAARTPLAVLFGAAAFILLIACLNVGDLLLARAETRRGSIALRRALGASRARVASQLLTEMLLLSLAGSALGVVVAGISLPFMVAASPIRFVGMEGVGVNGAVLAFAIGTALLATATTGLVPALRASSWNLVAELKRRSLGAVARTHASGRAALVVGEVALAVVLLVGAGLLLRSYRSLVELDVGFEPDELVSISVQLPRDRYADAVVPGSGPGGEIPMVWRVRPERLDFIERVRDAMNRIPGVVPPVASANRSPLSGPGGRSLLWPSDTRPPENAGPADFSSIRPVSADWFEAVGIPLVRGRSFHEEEEFGSENVIVLDGQTAEAFWPGRDPIGRSVMMLADTSRPLEVVGVAGNVRQEVVTATGEAYDYHVRAAYIPHRRRPDSISNAVIVSRLRVAFALRIEGDLRDVAPQLRQAVWSVDPDLLVTVQRVTDIAGQRLIDRRFYSGMLGAFGALGLLLAATGVFAVMSYSVSRKTREFGLRMALGARVGELERTELLRGLRLAALGIAIGGLGAGWLSRFLSSFLYGVGRVDPTVYAATALLLGAAALVAAYVPARRASRVDPVESLRVD
jgi:putative ABC transport system permease protein